MSLIVTPRQLKHRSEFYRELAALSSAGVALLQALEEVRRKPPAGSYREPVRRIIAQISSGNTLAGSLLSLGAWMPAFDLSLLQAGEQSGRLVDCFRMLSDYYADRARMIESLVVQLAYPVFIFHFAALVFPVHLIPALVWRGEIAPFLRQKLSLLVPIYAVVFLLIFAAQSRHGESWRAMLERVFRCVPLLGSARREQALARLAASLEALISAGVRIVEAWDLAAAASGSPAIRRAVHGWKPRVLAGELPSDQVNRSREFPQLFANLYYTGEVSGRLDEELRHLRQYYLDSASRKMQAFLRAVSILISLGVMLVIAFQIVSFWVNYYGGIFKSFE